MDLATKSIENRSVMLILHTIPRFFYITNWGTEDSPALFGIERLKERNESFEKEQSHRDYYAVLFEFGLN